MYNSNGFKAQQVQETETINCVRRSLTWLLLPVVVRWVGHGRRYPTTVGPRRRYGEASL